MRSREEVLRGFALDDVDELPDAVNEMADVIRYMTRQRDEFHAMWKAETLAKRDMADRIRELEPACAKCGGVPSPYCSRDPKCGEAVAWALMRDGRRVVGFPIAFALPIDAAEIKRVYHAEFVPLYAPPVAAVVSEAEALVLVALPDFKWAAWLLLHASKQGVNEHRSMGDSASVITQHIERIESALTAALTASRGGG